MDIRVISGITIPFEIFNALFLLSTLAFFTFNAAVYIFNAFDFTSNVLVFTSNSFAINFSALVMLLVIKTNELIHNSYGLKKNTMVFNSILRVFIPYRKFFQIFNQFTTFKQINNLILDTFMTGPLTGQRQAHMRNSSNIFISQRNNQSFEIQ